MSGLGPLADIDELGAGQEGAIQIRRKMIVKRARRKRMSAIGLSVDFGMSAFRSLLGAKRTSTFAKHGYGMRNFLQFLRRGIARSGPSRSRVVSTSGHARAKRRPR